MPLFQIIYYGNGDNGNIVKFTENISGDSFSLYFGKFILKCEGKKVFEVEFDQIVQMRAFRLGVDMPIFNKINTIRRFIYDGFVNHWFHFISDERTLAQTIAYNVHGVIPTSVVREGFNRAFVVQNSNGGF